MLLNFWTDLSATLIYLMQNIAVLFALVFIYGATNFNPKSKQTNKKIIIGLVIGGFAILVMNFPWELEPGIFYDTRSVLLSISAAFFGTIPGIIAGAVALLYRIFLGGDGVYAGSLTIVFSVGLGILFHSLQERRFVTFPKYIKYWIFGLVVSVFTMLAQLLLPWPKAFEAFNAVLLPYLVFFPLVTIVLGVAIDNQIDRLSSAEFLKNQQGLLQASIDSPKDMEIYAVDTNYNYLAYNEFHAHSIEKYYKQQIKPGQNYFDNIENPEMVERIKRCFDRALGGARFNRIDEVETNQGKFLENFYAPIYNEDGKIRGVTVFTHDISERKHYEESIIYLSYHDSLTGLKNRRHYSERLIKVENDHKALPIAIVMADINGLKLMNDAFGHDAGDELLKIVAKELSSTLGSKGEVARIGGDEFVSIMLNTTKEEAQNAVERAKREVEKHMLNSMKVSVSFG
ncbi:MAG: diguanylate cyclase, partial [Bacilli bacterium]|nr:diguanylate cyclase [Bacilli bacterium]